MGITQDDVEALDAFRSAVQMEMALADEIGWLAEFADKAASDALSGGQQLPPSFIAVVQALKSRIKQIFEKFERAATLGKREAR